MRLRKLLSYQNHMGTKSFAWQQEMKTGDLKILLNSDTISNRHFNQPASTQPYCFWSRVLEARENGYRMVKFIVTTATKLATF